MKVGDRVMLNPDSEFAYKDDEWNPLDAVGIITECKTEGLHYIVDWGTFGSLYEPIMNSYNEVDLIPV